MRLFRWFDIEPFAVQRWNLFLVEFLIGFNKVYRLHKSLFRRTELLLSLTGKCNQIKNALFWLPIITCIHKKWKTFVPTNLSGRLDFRWQLGLDTVHFSDKPNTFFLINNFGTLERAFHNWILMYVYAFKCIVRTTYLLVFW